MEEIINEIIFPKEKYNEVIKHCLFKLDCKELAQQQAYGFIGGKICEQGLYIEQVAPLIINHRAKDGPTKKYMDDALNMYALPTTIPNEERAWFADPFESKTIIDSFEKNNLQLVGTYHMHHMALMILKEVALWELPSKLDTYLAKDTELFMFIVEATDPLKLKIRAFYEGCLNKEVQIKIV